MALVCTFISRSILRRTCKLKICPKLICHENESSAGAPYAPLLTSRGMKRYVIPVKKAMKCRKEKMDPEPPRTRNTFLEWNINAELYAFGKRLGEDFKKDVLQQAFVERSYVIVEEEKQKKVGIEDPDIQIKDNRELAKQGTLMIEEYSKRYLRLVFPRLPEEGICSIVEYLLSDEVMADISKHIGTADIILSNENPPSQKTLANVLKSVVYALNESSGADRANLFIRDFIITYLSGKDINELWPIRNPESVLASIMKRDGKSLLEPRIIGEAGKATILSAYQVGLYCDKEFIGMGFGESLSVAKEIAALDALKRLFHTTERSKPIPFDLVLDANSKEPFANQSIQDWCELRVS